MRTRRRPTPLEPPPDPFGEHGIATHQETLQLLGGRFRFESDSRELLEVVRHAYAKLPPHRLSSPIPRFLLRLVLAGESKRADAEPPIVRPFSAGGMLGGVMAPSNFVAVTPEQRSGLVVVSPEMSAFPYHLRYELLEFAVYTLASRAQALAPLHAACVGRGGTGLLLTGPSGAGKSTLALQCLLHGFEFLAEDSVLVKPEGLAATGVANFLHIRSDSLQFLDGSANVSGIRESPLIRRRSGVEKLEIDLRRPQYRLAAKPLSLGAVIFLSAQSAGRRPLLVPLRRGEWLGRLAADQQYAASQPSWKILTKHLARVPGFELRRGRHPVESVEALDELLVALPRTVRALRPATP